ncbi:E3 ubiquitin-protein ligase RNF43 [Hemicordylus capensis]|uniref:E3 ubiquitin-protein ligase RNF43 n=1 Tax=Hemicordylus capensis TaxID=884348 RepID=UPI00230416C9|nr:E3 ubiquitin-protein ligase RNF43 [Hemicordylus capensis]
MRRAPQLQLVVLWPWLCMAALQVGLALVAAERASAQKAIIQVIPLKMEPLMLEGVFASVAEVTPAEGKLLQFHPLSLCNTSEDEHNIPGFVSIVKLERPERDLRPCLSLANKAKLAGERGAQAVLFDITDDQGAADQLKQPHGLNHPVVLIWGHDAELLMGVVNNNREAHVKIEVKETPAWPDYDVWILLTMMSTVLLIVLVFIIRTRCQPSRTRNNVQEETLQAISQLATRRYRAPPRRQTPTGDSVSTCSSAPVCAICLEEFSDGQELRIITCAHEFHRECVDLWLRQNQTCPLCMFNIVEQDPSAVPLQPRENPRPLGGRPRPRFFRPRPGHAVYHFPLTCPPRPSRNCPTRLPYGPRFFHSPELSQLDLGTMRYLPYGPVRANPWCSHQTPFARGLFVPQHQEPLPCQQAFPSRRPCLLQHQPACRGLVVPLAAQLSHATPHHRGIRHGRHHQHSSSLGESYLTEPSGYVPDGPGSDSSSGPCHGSSSDSMLNCTDVSLQAIHGSRSTFRSSLSSDYDPFSFCSSEKSATESRVDLSLSPKELQPQAAADSAVPSRAQLASNHVHYHHHHHRHHHYRWSPQDCLNGRLGQELGQRKARSPRVKVGFHSGLAQKRTEKMQLPEGTSAPQDASQTGHSSCPHPGHELDGSETVADSPAGAVGLRTSQQHYLQIHPGQRKWKAPLDIPQTPLSDDSHLAPGGHFPLCSGHLGTAPGSPPLALNGPSQHRVAGVSQGFDPYSSTEAQEQGAKSDCNEPMFPGEPSGTDGAGNNTSFYLYGQILQHLPGSKEEISGVYEHSV